MASNSKFISNLKLWFFIIPILMVTVIPMVNVEWLYTINQEELDSNIRIFGKEKHDKIQNDTDEQFARWFISSGLYGKSTEPEKAKGNTYKMAHVVDSFVNDYFNHLWKMVYRAQYRFHVAWQWFLGAIVLIGAAIYDGWQQRKIKKHIFGYSNPLAFHLVTHSFFTVIGSTVALFFFPTTLSPLTWFIGTFLLAIMGWKMAESFQTAAS